jgi:hypothetical protein
VGIDVSTLIADRTGGDLCQRPNATVSIYRGIIMADPQVLSTLRRRQADMENAIAAYEQNGRRGAARRHQCRYPPSSRPKSGLNMSTAVQAWRSGCLAQWILVEASAYTLPEHALV